MRGRSRTLAEAFEQAALALTAAVTAAEVEIVNQVKVTCRQDDLGLLFVEEA